MFEHIAIFISLIEAKSFSKASEKLNLAQGTISRKLSELEQYIGKILIIRDTRNMNLTEDGLLLYNKFKNIRKDFDNYLFEVNSDSRYLKNNKITLKICLHSTISYELICPYLKYYTKQFSDVELNIIFYSVDLINEIDFDIGISHRMLDDLKYEVKLLRNDHLKLFCSPLYIAQYGLPTTINELKKHYVVGGLENSNNYLTEIKSLVLINKYTKEEVVYKLKNSLIKTNSAYHAKKIGIAVDNIFWCWESLCEQEVLNGNLVPILPEFNIRTDNELYLVYKRGLNYEGEMFCEFLYKCMEQNLSINYFKDIIDKRPSKLIN
ncbi:MAG: LysR family transcriptional regulator [Proteobacteria bacterium]|nr:MAG: LysR family transcriptional regulator [Pseudomonadota bacterium]